ncbi:CoA-binding protein [Desmospora profundinema]|uniref:CoA-binding protein n=1 Tax=Desmospora profundinema TaxID=1571184 RepID=A0ABU1IRK1_9BACL|nr:CoA-binding protein [Desmospora profundinema]MDR6227413.1 putative CoA-binding protein [Desmospora profundinema]
MVQNPDIDEIKQMLKNAETIAVVGLSDKPHRTSYMIAQALQEAGYRIFPVNPTLNGPVLGERPYASVEEIGEPIDIVDVFRRSEHCIPVARDAVKAGAKAVWFQQGVINEEAAAIARKAGLTVVMDRCIKVDHAVLLRGRLTGTENRPDSKTD